MKMKFQFSHLLIALLLIMILGNCSNENVPIEVMEVIDTPNFQTDLIDFTEIELVDIIKLNFLQEYGGIEMEKLTINDLALTETYSCNIDTTITLERTNTINTYNIALKGNIQNKCDENFMVYNDHFIKFHSKDAFGSSKLAPFEIKFDMNTNINIGGNIKDNVYKFSGTSFRNLTFVTGLNQNQKIGGSIRFTSNFCPLDFVNNKDSEKIEYEVILSLYNQKIWDDEIKLKGTIYRESLNWVLKFENGTIHKLN